MASAKPNSWPRVASSHAPRANGPCPAPSNAIGSPMPQIAPRCLRPKFRAHRDSLTGNFPQSETAEEQRRNKRCLIPRSPVDDEHGTLGGRDRIGERRRPPIVETLQAVAQTTLEAKLPLAWPPSAVATARQNPPSLRDTLQSLLTGVYGLVPSFGRFHEPLA